MLITFHCRSKYTCADVAPRPREVAPIRTQACVHSSIDYVVFDTRHRQRSYQSYIQYFPDCDSADKHGFPRLVGWAVYKYVYINKCLPKIQQHEYIIHMY